MRFSGKKDKVDETSLAVDDPIGFSIFARLIAYQKKSLSITNFDIMKHYTLADIMNLERRFRGKLLNCMSGVKSANLIGTKSTFGSLNLAVFNSVHHIGANPPYLGFILRPTTVPRHTFQNIQDTQYYTINAITTSMYASAHQTSAKYAADRSEFEAVGLTPVFRDDFHAPYVAGSPIQIGLQLEETHLIRCNDTIQVIGKILQLYLPENSVAEDGSFDLSAQEVVGIGGLDTYYQVQRLEQLKYAKVKA
ncbi:MAG: flavin reductase [Bacteroidota bacterium]